MRKTMRTALNNGKLEIRFYFTNTRASKYTDHKCPESKKFNTVEEMHQLLKTPNVMARFKRRYYGMYARLRGVGGRERHSNEWYGGFYGYLPGKARRKYRLRNLLIQHYI